MSARSGITGWRDPELKVLWFGQINTSGRLDCAVRLRLGQGVTSRLRLTVAGQSHEANVTGSDKQQVIAADFGTFEIQEQAGYQRFVLESLNPPGTPFGELETLVLNGPASKEAHFNLKPRRNAASVHLMYPVPKESSIAQFYGEVTVGRCRLWCLDVTMGG